MRNDAVLHVRHLLVADIHRRSRYLHSLRTVVPASLVRSISLIHVRRLRFLRRNQQALLGRWFDRILTLSEFVHGLAFVADGCVRLFSN